VIINEALQYTDYYIENLQKIYTMMKKYPDVFKREMVTWELLEKLEACVDTRVFGTSRLSSCSLIPFCDAINHSCVRNSNQSVNKKLHLQGPEAMGSYFTPKKFAIDYRIVFGDTDKMEETQARYVRGLFNQGNYYSNESVDFADFTSRNL
jgi:hypothetical protein